MRRLLAFAMIVMLPLAAVAQWAPQNLAATRGPVAYGVLALAPMTGTSTSRVVVPLWRASDGRLLALVADDDAAQGTVVGGATHWSLHPVDADSFVSTGVRWDISPHLYTRAGVNRWAAMRSPAGSCPRMDRGAPPADCSDQSIPAWLGGEVGGGFHRGGFALDLGVHWLDRGRPLGARARMAPLHGLGAGLYGIPGSFIDSLDGINARGSMRVGDSDTRVSLGASIGRMELLPGSAVGFGAIDQKALSLGVAHGSISGMIVGRVMQPVAGLFAASSALDQEWNAIDLGITWHLPWQGELSFGAQNVWSSRQTPVAAPTDPVQHRMPYIQYHQDL